VTGRNDEEAKEKQHVHHHHHHHYVKGNEHEEAKQHDEVEKGHDHRRREREREHGHEAVTLLAEVGYGVGYDREVAIDRVGTVHDDRVNVDEAMGRDPHHERQREAEKPVRDALRYENEIDYRVVENGS